MCSNGSLFGESYEINVQKLIQTIRNERKNNDVLDDIFTKFSIFDSPQQIFDPPEGKLLRYFTHYLYSII